MLAVTLQWPDRDRLPEAARLSLLGPGAPLELVSEDVLGTTMPVFAQRRRNLRELLLSAAERLGDRPYLVFPERELSFEAVVDPVASVAAGLVDKYGIGKGDRVAIAAANCVEYALAFWAATCLGAVTVALNGWWTTTELTYGIEMTTPKVVFGDRRRLERLDGADLGVPMVAFEDDFAGLESYSGATIPDGHIAEDDPFLILFTSGTTGRPKGALLSHRSNIHFIQSSLAGPVARAAILADQPGGPPRPAPAPAPCIVSASPMFHVSGLNCQLVMATVTGSRLVYPPAGKWREDVFLQMSQDYRATNWSLVPTQLWRLLQWPELDRYDLSSLVSIGGGSAVWAPELLAALEERLPGVRPGLGTGYGATETNGLGTSLRFPDTYRHPDSIGEASPGVEVAVRDPMTGAEVGDDQVGEICLRSAANLLGYWDNPAATAEVLDTDRWYRTGDYGHSRDGFLYLAGRRRDLIIKGGENIYPVEIENRLQGHPEVAEVAVIGVPDQILGQHVKAVVVRRPGSKLSAEDLRRWASETLASFKVPTLVEFTDALPHNPSGKVMKHLLEAPQAASGFVEE
jgi:acyl-CoA synthetase (AMP-forming)/AMP-acid ligase II